MEKNYPCTGCTRVADPELCENKRCKVWQTWFMRSWHMACQRLDPKSTGAKCPFGGE